MTNENNEQFLKLLADVRESKDIDQIGELFLSVITMYGLTVDEVCAIAYYLVDTSLISNHNQLFIKDKLNINVDELGVEGKLKVMQAMIATYVSKVSVNDQA